MKLLLLALLLAPLCNAQPIVRPNFGVKSHETLEIEQIELSAGQTIVYLVVENKVNGGWFCADRNIYISPDNSPQRLPLIHAEGIPVCPQSHKFKAIGEQLHFSLIFPPLPAGTRTLDMIEDCTQACFSFRGVILSLDANEAIEKSFEYFGTGKMCEAAFELRRAKSLLPGYRYGLIDFHLIKTLALCGDLQEAARQLSTMQQSDLIDLDLWIAKLQNEPFYEAIAK